ncbi:MAG TPA: plasmid pRiA4b ORF-3 family protein [Firmicutes bacterium]|nr:plasmid pRiA4b ORF-3 family protein [Bacillota bacterium]
MSKQYSIKVYPAGMGREVYRNIEICGDETLDRLCQIILEAFDFDDEHLYEFCMDNCMYSENSYQSDPEEEDDAATDIALDKLKLNKGQKFWLHYDFGDDWMFTITVHKINEVEESFEPRIVKSKGQIQQYPYLD